MKTELIYIDELTRICGFFSSENKANNYYNCNHQECGDSDLMQKKSGIWEHTGEYQTYDRIIAPKMTTRKISCNRRLKKKFIKKARKLDHNNPEDLKKYGLKFQGKCYSFTCPFGHEAEEEDFEKPDDFQYDYLVIDIDLLKELEKK